MKMIHVYGPWYLSGDENQYILTKKFVPVPKDKNKRDEPREPVFKSVGYYTSLSDAVTAIIKREGYQLASGEGEPIELSEAVETLGRISDQIRSSIGVATHVDGRVVV